MKRFSPLIPYSRFHRSVLFLALLAKKNGPSLKGYPNSLPGKWNYAIHFWEEELRPYFKKMEQQIWSRLSGRDGELDQYIELMRNQQKMIAHAFIQLSSTAVNEENLHDLGILLEQHIRTKERKVFQHIQHLFTEEQLRELIG
ncbi:MAG TPA: hypothetical protein VJ917_05055 [Saprospiraceae bacterium]|nr:hypothetical protein [Saprospiraceae bacterium]